MIHVAICDDNEKIRRHIEKKVNEHCENCSVELFKDGEELLRSGADHELLFLDIEMPGRTGIDVARQIRLSQEKRGADKSMIIFVTAYREYMESAFDVEAFHYLLKPVADEKFDRVLDRAIRELKRRQNYHEKSIVVRDGAAMHKLYLKDIIYVESSSKKVVIHTTGKTVETYSRMQGMEELLGDTFFRCHRCYLVNMEHIESYRTDELRVTGGDRLFISKKKYAPFVKAYMQYIGNGDKLHA